MHYLGLGGTSYRVKAGVTSAQLSGGRSQSIRLTIAIAVMCAFIIALSIAIAVVDFLVRRDVRKIARQIVVASATFDRQGRLLVRPDGTLPMQLIETDADLKVSLFSSALLTFRMSWRSLTLASQLSSGFIRSHSTGVSCSRSCPGLLHPTPSDARNPSLRGVENQATLQRSSPFSATDSWRL